jgi:hypothetical protein
MDSRLSPCNPIFLTASHLTTYPLTPLVILHFLDSSLHLNSLKSFVATFLPLNQFSLKKFMQSPSTSLLPLKSLYSCPQLQK